MLVISKYIAIPPTLPLHLIDFTIGLDVPLTDKTTYDKGAKTETKYHSLNNELAIKKTFTDILDKGVFVGVSIKIEWYKLDGSVGFDKTIIKNMGTGVAFDYLRKRRQRSISYLQIASKGTPIETYVLTLLKHYKNEVDLFIQGNSNDFYYAVTNEADHTIKSMLDIVIDDKGKTVKDSIIYQIT